MTYGQYLLARLDLAFIVLSLAVWLIDILARYFAGLIREASRVR